MGKRVNVGVLVIIQVGQLELKRLFGDFDGLKVEDQSAIAFNHIRQQFLNGDIFLVIEVLVELFLLETDFLV